MRACVCGYLLTDGGLQVDDTLLQLYLRGLHDDLQLVTPVGLLLMLGLQPTGRGGGVKRGGAEAGAHQQASSKDNIIIKRYISTHYVSISLHSSVHTNKYINTTLQAVTNSFLASNH